MITVTTVKDLKSSRTSLSCDSCGAGDLPVIVTVGEKPGVPGVETATANLCYSCIMFAWASIIEAAVRLDKQAGSTMQETGDPTGIIKILYGKP